ncbi:hypothetical protein HMPREF9129_1280, partial [Peptoniphilus indolicus ATCC 29427]
MKGSIFGSMSNIGEAHKIEPLILCKNQHIAANIIILLNIDI